MHIWLADWRFWGVATAEDTSVGFTFFVAILCCIITLSIQCTMEKAYLYLSQRPCSDDRDLRIGLAGSSISHSDLPSP